MWPSAPLLKQKDLIAACFRDQETVRLLQATSRDSSPPKDVPPTCDTATAVSLFFAHIRTNTAHSDQCLYLPSSSYLCDYVSFMCQRRILCRARLKQCELISLVTLGQCASAQHYSSEMYVELDLQEMNTCTHANQITVFFRLLMIYRRMRTRWCALLYSTTALTASGFSKLRCSFPITVFSFTLTRSDTITSPAISARVFLRAGAVDKTLVIVDGAMHVIWWERNATRRAFFMHMLVWMLARLGAPGVAPQVPATEIRLPTAPCTEPASDVQTHVRAASTADVLPEVSPEQRPVFATLATPEEESEVWILAPPFALLQSTIALRCCPVAGAGPCLPSPRRHSTRDPAARPH